jgi:hypothetical protein
MMHPCGLDNNSKCTTLLGYVDGGRLGVRGRGRECVGNLCLPLNFAINL